MRQPYGSTHKTCVNDDEGRYSETRDKEDSNAMRRDAVWRAVEKVCLELSVNGCLMSAVEHATMGRSYETRKYVCWSVGLV